MHAEGMKYRQTSPWTVRKLLRTKETWFIGIGGGVLVMFNVGIMSNFIPMCASAGIEMNQAIFLMGSADDFAAAYSVRRARFTSFTSFNNATSIPSGS